MRSPRRLPGLAPMCGWSPARSSIADPAGVTTIHVETAREMRDAVERLLPADAAVFVAAVADWRPTARPARRSRRLRARRRRRSRMVENPDILAGIGHHAERPYLVVGFAAETQNLLDNAAAKLKKKGADFIVANDVSARAPA